MDLPYRGLQGTGRRSGKIENEVTPLKANGKLYLCTPHNVVIALDPDSGREIWIGAGQHLAVVAIDDQRGDAALADLADDAQDVRSR